MMAIVDSGNSMLNSMSLFGIEGIFPPQYTPVGTHLTSFVESEVHFNENIELYKEQIKSRVFSVQDLSFLSGLPKVLGNVSALGHLKGNQTINMAFDSGLTNVDGLLNSNTLQWLYAFGKFSEGVSMDGLNIFSKPKKGMLLDCSKNEMEIFGEGYLNLDSMFIDIETYRQINILRNGEDRRLHFWIANLPDPNCQLIIGRRGMSKFNLFNIDKFIAKMQDLLEGFASGVSKGTFNSISAGKQVDCPQYEDGLEFEIEGAAESMPPLIIDTVEEAVMLAAPVWSNVVEPVQAQIAHFFVVNFGFEAVIPTLPITVEPVQVPAPSLVFIAASDVPEVSCWGCGEVGVSLYECTKPACKAEATKRPKRVAKVAAAATNSGNRLGVQLYKLPDMFWSSMNPIMASIDPTKTVRLSVSSCNRGRGGILWQCSGEDFDPLPEESVTVEKSVIAYFSESHSEVMRRWPTFEQEASALHWLVTRCRTEILGRRTIIYTDQNESLDYLLDSLQHNLGRIIRWRLELREYEFTVVHIPRMLNCEADYLSRAYGDNHE